MSLFYVWLVWLSFAFDCRLFYLAHLQLSTPLNSRSFCDALHTTCSSCRTELLLWHPCRDYIWSPQCHWSHLSYWRWLRSYDIRLLISKADKSIIVQVWLGKCSLNVIATDCNSPEENLMLMMRLAYGPHDNEVAAVLGNSQSARFQYQKLSLVTFNSRLSMRDTFLSSNAKLACYFNPILMADIFCERYWQTACPK